MNEYIKEVIKRSREVYRDFLAAEERGDKQTAVYLLEVLEDIEAELDNLKINTLEDDQ